LYPDRREAIDFASKNQRDDHNALEFMKTALKDKYHGLRLFALQALKLNTDSLKNVFAPILNEMAQNDPYPPVKAGAIAALGKFKKEAYKPLYLKSLNDSSYSIAGNALVALSAIDTVTALEKARSLSLKPSKGALDEAITNVLFSYSDENDFDSIAERFDNLPFGNAKFSILQPFADFLKRINNPVSVKKGVDMIVSFRDAIPKQYTQMVTPYINGMILNGIASGKQSKGLTEQADYIKSKIPGQTK
jgi:aminopeptidase N